MRGSGKHTIVECFNGVLVGGTMLASIRESPCNYAVANIGKQDVYNVCQIGLRLLSYPGEYNAVS